MNTKTKNALTVSMLTAGIGMILSGAAVADLYKTSYTGAAWATVKIGTGDYKAVTSDAADSNKMVVSRNGALDIVYYDGSQWITSADAAVGKTYNALTKQENWGGVYYGSNAAGGLDKLELYWDNAKAAMALRATNIAATGAYKAVASKAAINEEAILAARDGALDYVYVSGGWAVWGNVLTGKTYTALASSAVGGNLYYGIWSGGIDRISFNGSWGATTIAGTENKGYTALQNDPAWDNFLYASKADGTMDKLQADGYGQWFISSVAGVNQAYSSLSATNAHNDMYGTSLATVPEPGSLATLSLGCLGAFGMMFKRKFSSK